MRPLTSNSNSAPKISEEERYEQRRSTNWSMWVDSSDRNNEKTFRGRQFGRLKQRCRSAVLRFRRLWWRQGQAGVCGQRFPHILPCGYQRRALLDQRVWSP
jgi:hypothetical protein